MKVRDEPFEYWLTNNEGLVRDVVARFSNIRKYPFYYEDLIAEAKIGMWQAYEKFDDDRGVKFTTYAYQAMMNACKQFIRKRNTKRNCEIAEGSLEYESNQAKNEDSGYNPLNILLRYDVDFDAGHVNELLKFKVDRALSLLSTEDEQLLRRCYGIGCEYTTNRKELSKELGFKNYANMNVHRWAAIKRLAKLLHLLPDKHDPDADIMTLTEFLEAS